LNAGPGFFLAAAALDLRGADVIVYGGTMLRVIMRGVCSAAIVCGLGLGAASAQDAAPEMTIYGTSLGTGWENWSWAKAELSVEVSGSARKPIRVEAAPWAALYLHHAPFDTKGYRKLSLLIQGSVPDREVRVFMLTDGKTNGEGKLVKIGNAGWTKVVVPLATLASENKLVDGLWVQNASGTDLPKFYVTEIKLL
jgi:hypothetical protein